jgi:23S rRNA (pseudouridine1915-N3)-methyltransferase
MRLLIAAIGKLKDSEERAIVARYAQRLAVSGKAVGLGPLETIEISESRAADAAARKSEEAARLLKAAGGCAIKIALDADGRGLSSEALAKWIGRHADSGVKACAFLIGGPDGHGREVLAASDLTLSLGAVTLPHGLARVVLAEQLYRAATILAGHPYHRA